jgi:hypothetical protein
MVLGPAIFLEETFIAASRNICIKETGVHRATLKIR